MRFEELAYTVDGLPVTVDFHARLTVMNLPTREERAAWVARLLGVLEGMRPGDGVSALYGDRAGRRLRLDRDEHGAATLTDLATGDEVAYSAAHLSLDGRLDWFASIGITARQASDAMVVDADAFMTSDTYDPDQLDGKLTKARRLLARVEAQRQAAAARARDRDDLQRRIADLDTEIDKAGRPHLGPATRVVVPELESLVSICRALAVRRDELIAGLGSDEAELLGQLVDDVEPAFVDALVALADACRPFDVTIDAARLNAAGLGAAGIDALTREVFSEIAARPAGVADPQDDAASMVEERSKLLEELHRTERGLPEDGQLARRYLALERCVAALEASVGAGRSLVSVQDAEAALLSRAAAAQRVGRRREPLPLVIDDALAPFSSGDKRALLDVVARLGETAQVIYLTGDRETLTWASKRVRNGEIALQPSSGSRISTRPSTSCTG